MLIDRLTDLVLESQSHFGASEDVEHPRPRSSHVVRLTSKENGRLTQRSSGWMPARVREGNCMCCKDGGMLAWDIGKALGNVLLLFLQVLCRETLCYRTRGLTHHEIRRKKA